MKKILTLALSLLFVFAAIACSNNKASTNNTTSTGTDKAGMEDYYNTYTGLYSTNIGGLNSYNMYTDVNTVNEAYKTKTYPGNEKYLAEVKAAYKDSRDKIQTFVTGLEKDVKTKDSELKKMNDDMIAQGKLAIKDIDAKMKALEGITESDYKKTQSEFIKLVDDTAKSVKSDANTFNDMLKNMDKKLGIDRTTNNTK